MLTLMTSEMPRKYIKGGAVIERQNHGSGPDILFSGYLDLPWRSAASDNLVDTGTARSDYFGGCHYFSHPTQQASLVTRQSRRPPAQLSYKPENFTTSFFMVS